MSDQSTVLLIGYGNPGRLDDGLGPALADAIEAMNLSGVTVDSNYQLSVEDADAISRHDFVLFVDASVSGREPFSLDRVDPRKEVSFSSHSISPEALMDMANNMLKGNTQGYILGIRGYEFNEFGECLSSKATHNLSEAVRFVEKVLSDKQFDRYVSEYKNV
jgi:hydrogenase maturation protease